MSWPMVALGEVAEVNPRMPRELPNTLPVSFLPMAAISEDGGISYQEERLAAEVRKGYTYSRRSDVLVAKITPCFENGKAAQTDTLEQDHGFGSTEFHVIRTERNSLLPSYAFHLLWNPIFRAEAAKNMTGSAGQKRVPADFIKGLRIPLPPLAEQQRIAGILDAADALRRRRREALDLLDALPGAIFAEMFGDPTVNPRNLPTTPLESFAKLERGKSKHRPRNDPRLLGGEHPLIQTGDVANANGYIERASSSYSDFGLQQSRKWPAGTLCITIAANIADGAILTFPACFPDSVVGCTPKNPSHTEFIRLWLQSVKSRLVDIAPTVAQKNINLKILGEMPIIVPGDDELEEFSIVMKQIRYQRIATTTHLAHLDALFASLQSRAFAGQL